jgi:hypothetical protein
LGHGPADKGLDFYSNFPMQVAALTPIINEALDAYGLVKSTPGIFTVAYGAVLDAISQTVDYETGSVTIPA